MVTKQVSPTIIDQLNDESPASVWSAPTVTGDSPYIPCAPSPYYLAQTTAEDAVSVANKFCGGATGPVEHYTLNYALEICRNDGYALVITDSDLNIIEVYN